MKTLIHHKIYLLSLVATCLLSSCGSNYVQGGRNIKLNDVSRFEVGRTTKAEVLEIFGEPATAIEVALWKCNRVHFGHENTVIVWQYFYASDPLSDVTGKSKFLQIEFDAACRVIDYYYESTFPEDDPIKSPTPANFNLFNARDQIMPGKTTRAEVLAILGNNYLSTAFNKLGVVERWHYEYSEDSKTEYVQLYGQRIRKTYGKSIDVFFDSNEIVLYCKGESDFPDDINVK